MSDRGKQRKLIMRITAVILTIVMTCISYFTALLFSNAAEGHVQRLLNDSDYYKTQAECIERRLSGITKKAGLPESVYKGIFETEEIINITKEYTANRLKGYDGSINQEAVKERIRANLYTYLESEGISKASISTEALNQYLSQAGSIYEQTVNNAFVLNYSSIRHQMIESILTALAALLVCAVLCIIFIYKMTKMRRKTLSYVNRVLIASVILTAIPSLVCLQSELYKKITFSPSYMENFVHAYVNYIFAAAILISAFWIILAVVLGVAILRIKHRKSR